MKKILFSLLFVLPLTFISCSDDDDNSESLNGTTWVNDEEGYMELKFKKTEFTWKFEYGEETDNDAGTYVYNPPIVSMTAVNRENGKIETFSGTFTDNKLYFGEIIYYKK